MVEILYICTCIYMHRYNSLEAIRSVFMIGFLYKRMTVFMFLSYTYFWVSVSMPCSFLYLFVICYIILSYFHALISRFSLSSVLEMCQAAVAEVIQVCEEVASLASPVVCNSSPEGFLPSTKVKEHSTVQQETTHTLYCMCRFY